MRKPFLSTEPDSQWGNNTGHHAAPCKTDCCKEHPRQKQTVPSPTALCISWGSAGPANTTLLKRHVLWCCLQFSLEGSPKKHSDEKPWKCSPWVVTAEPNREGAAEDGRGWEVTQVQNRPLVTVLQSGRRPFRMPTTAGLMVSSD